MGTICQIRGACRSFGAVNAVVDFDSEFQSGEIVGIIGPNGSGKTTLLNCISGFLRFSAGHVDWRGQDVTSWSMDRLARNGLVRTFQQSMYFPSRSVAENLEIACQIARTGRRTRRGPDISVDRLLMRTGMADLADKPSSSLSHGGLRLVGIAMALALSPEMLLLDEPAAGLNDAEASQLAEIIIGLRREGVTTVVVDHDMSFMMSIAERLIVMASGEKLIEGPPAEVIRDKRVIEVYLGSELIAPPEHDSDPNGEA